jgi:hypothetical protein
MILQKAGKKRALLSLYICYYIENNKKNTQKDKNTIPLFVK